MHAIQSRLDTMFVTIGKLVNKHERMNFLLLKQRDVIV